MSTLFLKLLTNIVLIGERKGGGDLGRGGFSATIIGATGKCF
jgi:hypothetical protein